MDASICPQTKDFQLKNIPSTIIKKKKKSDNYLQKVDAWQKQNSLF